MQKEKEALEKLKPLKNKIIFTFLEDVSNGQFTQQTKSGIIVAQNKENQIDKPRWGKVVAIGPDVSLIKVDEYILVEALRWTNALSYEGCKFWVTNEDEVAAVSDEAIDEF